MRHSLRRARLRARPTARATLAATATVLATTVSGALLLSAFTVQGPPDERAAAARCAAGAPGACVGGAPVGTDDRGYAAPTALPTDPSARTRYPITVAPLTAVRSSGGDTRPGHSGPPMDGDMAVGGGLVLLGSGLALAVLYRSRAEGGP
ncbi:hypothetical protein [Streptomyces caatingaensis]|uniref:Uncharacterized protein n=1 Tax=Streptomyces caatingaensis TaxID=1678637 RepID=A0A0K9X7H2_9ACTN|nr:hypothetical protein [Streptomyces caatingaensis]KNB49389.1 hypothetical protein AC230_29470 [Streptomyces caatingaensis]